MTQPFKEDSRRPWSEPWAMHVLVQADTVESKMRIATARPPIDERRQAAIEGIETLLRSAREAATHKRKWFQLRGPVDRFRGASVDRAYKSLHAAKMLLIELLPQPDVDALIPSAIAGVATSLKPTDARRLKIDRLLEEANPERRRAGLKQALELGYTAKDEAYARARGFRNILLATAALIAVFMIGLVITVAITPRSMPLCFEPDLTAPTASQAGATRSVCPSGEDTKNPATAGTNRRKPHSTDVAIVAGLGLLGGALAAAFAIRKIRGSSTPYDVPIALACLKVPSGSLTAVAGILLLGGGFVPGLSELDSQRQILAYALIFGYSQQLATRFIDDQAQTILDKVPSKDPDGNQPTPSTPASIPEQHASLDPVQE